MKEDSAAQFIEKARDILTGKQWQEDPENSARTIAFDLKLSQDVHPMLHLVQSMAWDIQEFRLDDPTVDAGKDREKMLNLMSRYEANDWIETKWSTFFTYKDAEDKHINIAVHVNTDGYAVEGLVPELVEAVKLAVKDVPTKQTNRWFVQACSRVAPKKVGEYHYAYSDVNMILELIQ